MSGPERSHPSPYPLRDAGTDRRAEPEGLDPLTVRLDPRGLPELVGWVLDFAERLRFFARLPDGPVPTGAGASVGRWRAVLDRDPLTVLAEIRVLDVGRATEVLGGPVSARRATLAAELRADLRRWASCAPPGSEMGAVLAHAIESVDRRADAAGLSGVAGALVAELPRIATRAPGWWRDALRGDWPFHAPHVALVVSALDVYRHPKALLDGLVARHLDYAYEQVLDMRRRPALPDSAHVVVELARTVAHHRLAAGTLFDGGRDDAGPVRFRLDDDTAFDRSAVADVRGIVVRPSGPGGALEVWSVPGAIERGWPHVEPGGAGPDTARRTPTGFVVTSPLLHLTAGTRRIELSVDFAVPLGEPVDARALADVLEVRHSVAQGWVTVPVAAAGEAPGVEFARAWVRSAAARLSIVVVLPADHPPVEAPSASGVEPRLPNALPGLQILAASIDEVLRRVRPHRVELHASAEGVVPDTALTPDGPVDPSGPFAPFGSRPLPGAAFYVDHQDLRGRRLERVSLHIERDDRTPLTTIYAHYPRPPAHCRVALQHRDRSRWRALGAAADWIIDTHGPATDPAARAADPKAAPAGSGGGPADRLALGGAAGELRRAGARPPLRLSLLPDVNLLHAEYPGILARAAVEQMGTGEDAALPGTPFVPRATGVTLAHRSSAAVEWGAVEPRLAVHHVGPFGCSAIGHEAPTLAPDPSGWDALLHIGLSDATPSAVLSLLVQVAERSEEPGLGAPGTRWHALVEGDVWRPFEPGAGLIGDETDGLLRSGLVRLRLPPDLDPSPRSMPGGRSWLRLDIESAGTPERRPGRGACRVSGLYAQAARVTRVEPSGEMPAAPGRIGGLVRRDPAVKRVSQPHAAFGGRPPEAAEMFRRRVSERIRHRGRALAPWDYEHLVLDAFPEVHRVRCLVHSTVAAGGRRHAPGRVTLAVIGRPAGRVADRFAPGTGHAARRGIASFVRARAPLGVEVDVVAARFARVEICGVVRIRSDVSKAEAHERVHAAIDRFLAPWVTHPGSAPTFGRSVHVSQIVALLDAMPDVVAPREFRLRVHDPDPGPWLEDYAAHEPHVLLTSLGAHVLVIEPDSEPVGRRSFRLRRSLRDAAGSPTALADGRAPGSEGDVERYARGGSGVERGPGPTSRPFDPLVSPTVSATPPPTVALDVERMRREAVERLRRLAGGVWTDHNVHDPGITMMEAVTYGWTDLSYRATAPIADLLAASRRQGAGAAHRAPSGESAPSSVARAGLFSASELLPCAPVTAGDLRRVLLDVPGVRDVRCSPARGAGGPPPAGVFDLDVDFESDLDPAGRAATEAAVREAFHLHRPLATDLAMVRAMPVQSIRICADLELRPGVDVDVVRAQVLVTLDEWLRPSLSFRSLAEARAAGESTEALFTGPLPSRGFIDGTSTVGGSTPPTDALHASDVYRLIIGIDGVDAVTRSRIVWARAGHGEVDETLGDTPGGAHSWVTGLIAGHAPRVDIDGSRIRCFVGGVPRHGDPERLARALDGERRRRLRPRLPPHRPDHEPPEGEPTEVRPMASLQSLLPAIYGVGRRRLPADASDERRGQAAQLRAFLLIFDQLRADYLAQLRGLPLLLSSRWPLIDRLGFEGTCDAVPGADMLLVEREADAPRPPPGDDPSWSVVHARLDHLLARHGDGFGPDERALRGDGTLDAMARDKAALLADIARSAHDRGRGIDLLDPDARASAIVRRIVARLGLRNPLAERRCQVFRDALDRWRFRFVLDDDDIVLRSASSYPRQGDAARALQTLVGAVGRREARVVRLEPGGGRQSFGFAILDDAGRRVAYGTDQLDEALRDLTLRRLQDACALEQAVSGRPEPILPGDLRIETYRDKDDAWRFRFRHPGSDIVLASSRGWPTLEDAETALARAVELGRHTANYTLDDVDDHIELRLRAPAVPGDPGGGDGLGPIAAVGTDHLPDRRLADRRRTELAGAIAEMCVVEAEPLLIEHVLLRPLRSGDARRQHPPREVCDPTADPYGHRSTMLLPAWAPGFGDLERRALAEQIVRRELPAHVAVRIVWVDAGTGFCARRAWQRWRIAVARALAEPDSDRAEAARERTRDQLVERLVHARTVYPEARLYEQPHPSGGRPTRLGRTRLGSLKPPTEGHHD